MEKREFNEAPELKWIGMDNIYEKFGLKQFYLSIGDLSNNSILRKIITRNGEIVGLFGKDYHLFPNELAIEIAEEAAKAIGARPFGEFDGSWFTRTDSHIFYTQGRRSIATDTQVHCLYYFPEDKFKINGDDMNLGIALHNSIDGTMALQIGSFTFRHACSNMVLAGSKGWRMGFDSRETLVNTSQKHSRFFDPAFIEEAMLAVRDATRQIIPVYERWAEEQIQMNHLKQLKKELPDKYLPEYLQGDKDEKIPYGDYGRIWDVYNDITARIWHNNTTSYLNRERLFTRLHEVLVV